MRKKIIVNIEYTSEYELTPQEIEDCLLCEEFLCEDLEVTVTQYQRPYIGPYD